MKLFELMKAIKLNTLPKFLIFTGPEYAIMEIYIKHIAEQFKLNKQNITTVNQIIKEHRSLSLIGDNNLYICKYDNSYCKQDKLWTHINSKLGPNYMILILNNIDKRGKFYKHFEKDIVEFCEQDEFTLLNMLRKQVSLTDAQLQRLAVGCENNYSRCLLEIDKIKQIAQCYNITEQEAYNTGLRSGVICEVNHSQLQQFTNAVLTRNPNCFKLYEALIKSGEPNMIIITWLYNAVRNQLSVQSVQKATQETLGMKYFFIKECLDRKGYFNIKELYHFLNIIVYCEQGIKLGYIEDAYSVQYILASVL